ncbi:MAG: DegT/DnrJ/EryC1/StrS family aminotransferase [Steroidobacteraceae bacterium]|nr:DegT/DnrJ/EryC1/StrS family aminotransferase [Steroidobacteraceae bacterium]
MSFIAPAGTPVTIRDLASGLAAPGSGASEALRAISGLPHAWSISSGRAAMTIILEAMRQASGDSKRDEVIVPAYTCYSVPASIERAGLRPRLCDVVPATLGTNPEVLRRQDFSRVLAVVSSNLYGLPNDLAGIESVCKEQGVLLLDDAAQALGARVDNRAVGSFGEAGLYSFDKGKVISTIQGGAIVCRPGPVAERLESAIATLPASGLVERVGNALKLGIYSVFLRPTLYPMIRALPFTGLGHTVYKTRFPIARLSNFSTAVATRLIGRLDELASARRRNAAALTAALEGEPGIELIRPLPGSVAAWVRFPLLVSDPDRRARLIAAFERAGIGATASYPRALADVPAVRSRMAPGDTDYPGARRIAQSIVTLPTHAYCPPDLPERVRKVIRECRN